MDVIVKAAVVVPSKITGEACKTTRPLWEEVFYEDSVRFTDYYFENKAEKNIGYVLGQAPYDAMMFRTPYELQIGKEKKEISYIVGVATRKECRHRGYMRNLLMYSFREMYKEKMPFAFLMPANPAIYEPFDFRYVYERDVWTLKDHEKEFIEAEVTGDGQLIPETGNEIVAAEITSCSFTKYGAENILQGLYSVRNLQKQLPDFPVIEQLADFANQYLKEHCNIYVHRNVSYYEMQLKESEAQNGDIYVLFERGEIQAFFLYAREEDEVFIQEVMEKETGTLDFLRKAEKKKPIIMARIIHLEEMMKLVCSKERKNLIIKIEDDLIPENAGIYQWEITPTGSNVRKLLQEIGFEENSLRGEKRPETDVICMHIRELVTHILTGVFINEIV